MTALFGELSGGLSGGTIASAAQSAAEADGDREVRRILGNPYALDPDPGAARPPAPDEASIGWNHHLRMFTVPFVMAQVNTRVVRRSHALAGFPWGEGFVYREVMSTPGSPRGAVMAAAIAGTLGGIAYAFKRKRLREPARGRNREALRSGASSATGRSGSSSAGATSSEVIYYTASNGSSGLTARREERRSGLSRARSADPKRRRTTPRRDCRAALPVARAG